MCLFSMNNTKHTPGPWTWDGEFGLGWYAELVSPEKYVGHYSRPQALSREESKANARLIAAAPELLAALEDILPHAIRDIHELNEQMVGSLYPSINLAKIKRAEDAIAKAKGER